MALARKSAVSRREQMWLRQIWGELRRRNVIKVFAVYVTLSIALLGVLEAISDPFRLPDASFRLVFILLILALPIALVLAWAYDLTPAAPADGPVTERESLPVSGAPTTDRTRSPGSQATSAHTFENFLTRRFEAIDERVNKLIAGEIVSPTRNNRPEPFSSERIVNSLARLGMPTQLALRIAASIDQFLPEIIAGEETISTAHIRQAVSHAIYRMSGASGDGEVLKLWADRYVRRYGNPDERIHVFNRDGTVDLLDYNFIKDRLIPHVAEHVYGPGFARVLGSAIRRMDLDAMARETLEHARSLCVYSIRYKTLFNVTYDLATQPPDAWFVDEASGGDVLAHHLDQAASLLAALDREREKQSLLLVRHDLGELVHHSSAALLAHYNAFLGAGRLRPLHQLIHNVTMADDRGNPLLWQFYGMSRLEGDLAGIEESRGTFYRLLIRIRQNVNQVPDKWLEKFSSDARRLHEIARFIIGSRASVDEMVARFRNGDNLSLAELQELTTSVLRRLPGIVEVSEAVEDERMAWLWVRHDINTALFREIKPRLLVGLLPDGEPMDQERLTRVFEAGSQRLDASQLSNALLLIIGRQDQRMRPATWTEALPGGTIVACLDAVGLAGLVDSSDQRRSFEAVFDPT